MNTLRAQIQPWEHRRETSPQNAPVALSFYAAKEAPGVKRVVPTELKDNSVSGAPGQKLSYFGYEFMGIAVHLFSDDGSIEMIFFQKDYQNRGGVTQPEINRIVQSLHESRSDARN